MGSTVKKFLATLLIACFTLTAGIGCSGDSTKEKKKDKEKPAAEKPAAEKPKSEK